MPILPRLLAALVLGLATAAPAQQGRDLRDAEYWETGAAIYAVGRLDVGRGRDLRGFCTATLVTPTLVLTAAHCVFDPDTAAAIPLEDLSFRAGYNRGRVRAERGVRRVVVHPDYAPSARNDVAQIGADLALVELDREIDRGVIRPIPVAGRLERGDRVRILSYGADRARAASFEDGCRVRERTERVLAMDCDVIHGSSGAPVFVADPTGWTVASVVSSMAGDGTDRIALAAAVEGGVETLFAAFERAAAPPPAARKVLRFGEDASGERRFGQGGGIRFIRVGD